MLTASGLMAPAVGNIGSPLSDQVGAGHDCLVVEVSSFQLRFTELFHPVAAAITNVAVDHLDWHGSEYAYKQAKARVYGNQTEGDLLVYDADDPGATELAGRSRSRKLPVSGRRLPDSGGGVSDGRLVMGDFTVELSDLSSADPVHVVNLACAAGIAQELGASPDGVAQAARKYVPGAHRRRLVLSKNGVSWVDDSKATNPHAALASIEAHQPVVLIAGGLAKGLDLKPLATADGMLALIGIGEAGPSLVDQAGPRGHLAGTLEIAVEMAAGIARPGDTVLLAPGCASFDQFSSYEERGDRFAELARGASQ